MEIFLTAAKVRGRFERKEINYSRLAKLYLKYNQNINHIKEFIQLSKELFPKGNCGLVSIYLKDLIGGEIINGSYNGHNLTFLLFKNKIIDITADQFGGPSLYIGKLRDPWSKTKRNL